MTKPQRLTDLVQQTRETTLDYLTLRRFVNSQYCQYKHIEESTEFLFTAENFDFLTVSIPLKRKWGLPSSNINIQSARCTDYYPSIGNARNMCRINLPLGYDSQDAVAKLEEFITRYASFEKSRT